jgi:hypothetical protein
MNIAQHSATHAVRPSNLIARLGVGGYSPVSPAACSTGTHTPTEVLIDAATVSVSILDGILRVFPAPHITALNLNIEECSDGAILISDEFGYAGFGAVPELRGLFKRIHITVGVDGDDDLVFYIPSSSRLHGKIRIFSAFGDDITDISTSLFTKPLR